MDLCLTGSQINLATRQKPKQKLNYASQINLERSASINRPRSATLFQRRSRSSPFLLRPQSADPKFRRNFSSSCGQYCSENELLGQKWNQNSQKYPQSLSSSNLLKLLLEEPIKRPWLCRSNSGGDGSPDDQSELSSSHKTASYSSLNKKNFKESGDGSSAEGEISEKYMRTGNIGQRRISAQSLSRMSSSSSLSNLSKDKYSALAKSMPLDHWQMNYGSSLSTANFLQKNAKPDLPGRVSFSKPNLQHELDSSDCDNDKQEKYLQFNVKSSGNEKGEDKSISAPGPLTLTSTSCSFGSKHELSAAVNAEPTTTTASKKSVHFGGSEAVLAETYEYPKCPSDNCSCSTRSSSTASLQDGVEQKCACESSTCKYALDTKRQEPIKLVTEKPPAAPSSPEESEVIREYKNTIGPQVENSIVKNMLEERRNSREEGLNNIELPAYLEKYASPAKKPTMLEKQNNLSEPYNSTFKAEGTRNSFDASSRAKSENNLHQNLTTSKVTYTSSSESVINNYLKVAASSPYITKKKENNKPGAVDSSSTSYNMKKSKTSSATLKSRASSAKLKKAISFGSLREDANLNEFNLDKVDSWMSMHEDAMSQRPVKERAKETPLGDDYEKFTKESLNVLLNDAGMEVEEDEEQGDSNSQLSMKSDENSPDDSTYDEIVSVIKEIEEDKKQDNYAERSRMPELDLKLNSSRESADRHSGKENRGGRADNMDSPDKYTDILNYLDNVEDSCEKTLQETRRSMPDSNRSEIEFIVEPDIAEDVPKLADLLLVPNHQLARRVIALSLRANELANAIVMSKENVMKIKMEKQKTLRAEKANSTTRLRDQKKHYETIVKRHQGFIEQLLKDKGSLCEKVAALTRRLESQNQAWEHKLETEIIRMKETTLAGEKIKRERWVRENTKKIKELTVKGLETEINKMTSSHQRELTELKRNHQQHLQEALEEARLKHEQIENSIRESCAQDREAIIEKERTAIRERFERQLEEERKSFDEQKHKLLEDIANERERHQQELKSKEMEYQTRRQEIQREKEEELEQAINELHDKMTKQDEKYQNRINTIEKQYESDFQIWKKDYENSCKMAQVEKENTIRQHYRAERDRQIDAIVSRMDAEAVKNNEEYETKLNRLREKYEKDLLEVESNEKSLREKYTETRGKLAESDAQVRNYQAEIKQLEMELGHSKKMCDELLSERDQLRENLRNELQSEMTTLKSERDSEIQKIHKRVQQAIEKKDATIDILTKENGSLRERCLKLEAIIRQQRKDYCVK